MFEALSNVTSKVTGSEGTASQALPLRMPAETTESQERERALQKEQKAEEIRQKEQARQEEERREVTQRMLDGLEHDIQSIHNIGLRFARHDGTGRTMIKVLDRASEELIREIPSEEVLNLAAKIEEMIGILFDKKV